MTKSPLRMTATVGLFVLLAGLTVSAQSGTLRGYVPFDFVVGTTTMEAGTYSIALSGISGTSLAIKNGSHAVAILSSGRKSDLSDKPTRLVFHRYGQRYFLREVWFAGDRGQTLPELHEERVLIDEQWRIAGSGPVTVAVMASAR
jgi:hypothetical protein